MNTQEQIIEIFNKHFHLYSCELSFIDQLGCNAGMCAKFNNNRKFIYQFLPTPIPKASAEYIFICKEPSIQWADGTTDAYNKVINKQYMNFISGIRKNNKLDIMISAFRKVFDNKSIFITDMSKCALDTNVADDFGFGENLIRYKCCAPYLRWEFEKLTIANPNIFIVGKNYFFKEWIRRKDDQIKNEEFNDIDAIHKFMDDVVKVNVHKSNIFPLPHYSIRFSCPEYILRMLKKEHNEIQKEIENELSQLYQYYLDNFILTKNVEESIISSINNPIASQSNAEFSDSIILLYLLYKNEFEIAKKQWHKSQ